MKWNQKQRMRYENHHLEKVLVWSSLMWWYRSRVYNADLVTAVDFEMSWPIQWLSRRRTVLWLKRTYVCLAMCRTRKPHGHLLKTREQNVEPLFFCYAELF